MNTDAPMTPLQHKPVQIGAIFAGVLTFAALYALLGLLLLFVLALLSERVPSHWLYGGFKALGLLSWIVPGYVAARIAGRRGWLHGALTGIGVGSIVVITMALTFSWEGTEHDAVRNSMVTTFLLVLLLCTLGGWLGDLLAARASRRNPS